MAVACTSSRGTLKVRRASRSGLSGSAPSRGAPAVRKSANHHQHCAGRFAGFCGIRNAIRQRQHLDAAVLWPQAFVALAHEPCRRGLGLHRHGAFLSEEPWEPCN